MIRNNQFVTIVSGLPRSGTSMMMRMLEAGGMPVMTDGLRTPDDDNPNGYYEYEPVKRTRNDASWLEMAPGRAVKMVYRLLYDLPRDYAYRVVFMRRNLKEVLASQQTMLDRQANVDSSVDDALMDELFRTELQMFETWITDRENFGVHEISYNNLLDDPRSQLDEINRFLAARLDIDAMIDVIDPSLYRNRC